MICFGVDVARSGEDKSCIYIRKEWLTLDIVRMSYADTMETAGHVAMLARKYRPERINIDVIGVGAGVYDRLRELEFPVIPFNSSARTEETDISGELQFLNLRSCAWWKMRELLDPKLGVGVALPNDEMLIKDLTTPKWKASSMGGGRIQIESKDDIRKRLKRSPDTGDSCVMCFWEPNASFFEDNFRLQSASDIERYARGLPPDEEIPKIPESILFERELFAAADVTGKIIDPFKSLYGAS